MFDYLLVCPEDEDDDWVEELDFFDLMDEDWYFFEQNKSYQWVQIKALKYEKKPEKFTSGFYITSSANLNLFWGVIGE